MNATQRQTPIPNAAVAEPEQAAVIRFLETSAAHHGASVERIDTHASVIFLVESRVYKVKRAVRFDYLDFSTVERRRACCEAEVTLNRRTAPTIYRRVVPVTREADGRFAVGGDGPAVEWLVEMNRFDQEGLLDRLAAAGRVDGGVMDALADAVAALHGVAEHRPDHGGAGSMTWIIEGNARDFAEFHAGYLDPSACAALTDEALREVDRHRAQLDARRASGFVRHCHGDLHLRNIVLIDGQPTIFDGIEFNDALACIDVYYDLAFLLMDLMRRNLGAEANRILNRYVARTGDLEGLGLLPLFLSCRAAVRAKTSITAARVQVDQRRREELQIAAGRYLALASAYLRPVPAVLIAIGGFSGSGKSTLARGLAPSVGASPGALVLRSDEMRKQLLGTGPLRPLGPEGYTAEVSERVYRALNERAVAALRARQSVIVDAVFAESNQRRAVAAAAADGAVPFVGLWLNAPEATLLERVRDRRGDASDAGPAVVQEQLARGSGATDWVAIEANGSASDVLHLAAQQLSSRMRSMWTA